MRRLILAAVCAASAAVPAAAQDAAATAHAFGAREYIRQISLSPDGQRVAIVIPVGPRGTGVMVADPIAGGEAKTILRTPGTDGEQVTDCHWATANRIVCEVAIKRPGVGVRNMVFSRLIALNADGRNQKQVTARQSYRALGVAQFGGDVIDWTGDGKGGILMARSYVPEQTIGTRLASSAEGLGVERVDVTTLRRSNVEYANADAVEYLTDGNGHVRIVGTRRSNSAGYDGNVISYSYRKAAGGGWQPLGKLTLGDGYGTGFNPVAIDRALDAVYGFEAKDGRQALYRVKLDGSMARELVLDHEGVDVDGLIRIGRQRRVVGASYATERRETVYFDKALERLSATLGKALPGKPIVGIVDASDGERQLLIFAGSDDDPGRYYLYDKATRAVVEVLPARPELEGVKLATMTPVRVPAADGTAIPGYLTLPHGSTGKGLPAIVMPHGGPGSRDEWGFDWWAQYFAARGFAVLQPNFRGSAGYGAGWFQKNGFQSWRTAIGDVNDAGRWLLGQGIAAPGKLAIVGWSYGGYAALQSAALDPDLFKAIVAVAPVTDLETLRAESLGFTNYPQVDRFIGRGAHVRQGSPARNAAAIRAPVLLFHGDIDVNVGVGESRLMAKALREAGRPVDYVEYKGLDHQLDDGEVRAAMLERSDAFLRRALGL